MKATLSDAMLPLIVNTVLANTRVTMSYNYDDNSPFLVHSLRWRLQLLLRLTLWKLYVFLLVILFLCDRAE